MRVFISTVGSHGDIRPFVALGKGLLAAGHEVSVCASHCFENFISENGLHYSYMNDDLMELIESDEVRSIIEKGSNIFQMFRHGWKLLLKTGPMQQRMLDDNWKAAEAFQPDVLIYHPKAYGCPHYSQKLGKPSIMAALQPIMIPTSRFPNMMFPQWNLGGWYNRMTHQILLKLMSSSVYRYARKWRAANGMPPKPSCMDGLHDHNGRHVPVLQGYSPLVAPVPDDWPECCIASGYWFLDEGKDWQPSKELASFLNAGPPPVYAGFGSMAGREPERLARIILEAFEKTGVRGIIATGWGGISADTLPENVMKIDKAPHDWLFPKMSAVIHHGGAGTTAAGLRAGCPSIICPFIVDQPFWGRRITELGAGVSPCLQKKLTTDKLAGAISEVTGNPSYRKNANSLQEKLEQEDGIANAVRFIENVVGKG